MKRKIVILSLIAIIIIGVVIAINHNRKIEVKELNKKINPISKETAIKILEAEYGNLINITVDDIKQVKDEYVINVNVNITDDDDHGTEEENHDHEHDEAHDHEHKAENNNGEHTHKIEIGEHKINIYSGELKKPVKQNQKNK